MNDSRRLALELHEIRMLALAHATNPQFGNSSVDGEGLLFRDADGNDVGRIGGDGNGLEVEYVYGPKPLMPSTPIVSADANLILVRWDGSWSDTNADGGSAADPDLPTNSMLDRVEIHVSMDPNFVPDPIESFAGVMPVTGEGGQVTVGPLSEADDFYVVLLARGKDGQYSAPSERVHVVTTVGAMENELFDLALRADEAMESADGKNKVYYGDDEPSPPEGGFKDGDLWFGPENMPHLWDPSAGDGGDWVSARDERFNTVQDAVDQLADDLEHLVIDGAGNYIFWSPTDPRDVPDQAVPDGSTWFKTSGTNIVGHFVLEGGDWSERKIADESIANLNAGKIDAGFIDAARIQAGTVTADKLLVGSPDNLVVDPMWANPGENWELPPGATLGAATLPGGAADRVLKIVAGGAHRAAIGARYRAPRPGKFLVRLWVKVNSFTPRSDAQPQHDALTFVLEVVRGGSTSWPTPIAVKVADMPGMVGQWVQLSGVVDLSSGDIPEYVAPRFMTRAIFDAGTVEFYRPEVVPMVGSTLIEPGAITTGHIRAGSITAESGIVGSLDAGVITTGELRGELIRAESIAAGALAADAIDGKTITGATVRTSAAGARVEMNTTGLRMYNQFGAATLTMTNGSLSVEGGTITGGTVRTSASGARVQLDATGLKAWNPSNEQTFMISANTGTVDMTGDLKQVNDYGDMRFGPTLYTSGAEGGSSPALAFRRSGAAHWGAAGLRLQGAGTAERLVLQGPYRSEGVGYALQLPVNAEGGLGAGIWRWFEGTSSYFSLTPSGAASVTSSGDNAYLRATPANSDTAQAYVTVYPRGDVRVLGRGGSDWIGVGTDSPSSDSQEGIYVRTLGDLIMYSGRLLWPNLNTTTGSANLRRTNGGYIGEVGSSRHLKIAAEPITATVPGLVDRLLSVDSVTWFDRVAAERIAAAETEKANGVVPLDELDDVEPLRRIPGVIAEDLHDAGLGVFVEYDSEGAPSSVMYDRIGPALIPIVRELRDRINDLEKKVA